jgi:hypothetical protein
VTALPPSKAELDNLRSIVARSLKDVTVAGLSADYRFVMAYDAARTQSLLVVRANGYRPRAVGGHYNTFLALEAADPAFAKLSAYFDGCFAKVFAKKPTALFCRATPPRSAEEIAPFISEGRILLAWNFVSKSILCEARALIPLIHGSRIEWKWEVRLAKIWALVT